MDSNRNPKPLVSVVICSRNRKESPNLTLSCFCKVETKIPWKLAIVDNGSTDGTAELLDQWDQSSSLKVVHFSVPTRGLSRARNLGIDVSRGDIICFTDDDCYPDEKYIESWGQVFSEPCSPDFCGGRIELFDPSDSPETIKTDREPIDFPPFTFVPPGSMHGASMAFRRSAIRRIGRFDEQLGAGTSLYSAEDADYLQRVSLAGFLGRYDPRPLVWHHHGRKSGDLPALQKGYQIGKGAFFAKLTMSAPRSVTRFLLERIREGGSFLKFCKHVWWKYRKEDPRYLKYKTQGALLYSFALIQKKITFRAG